MNPSDLAQRFAELDAARALGDLSPAEQREWTQLVEVHGFEPDAALDDLVASLETTLGSEADATLAPELQRKLEASAAAFTAAEAKAAGTDDAAPVDNVVPFWRHPALGWAAAAALAIVAFWPSATPVPPRSPSPAEARAELLAQADDVMRLDFSGVAEFEGLSGDVVWADGPQAGYMRLAGLPSNNPDEAQYQLWIVDPERDERPVDGGVFDIPAGADGEVVVPIQAALRVRNPAAFVITVEKPGGVVVSAQEKVAAIAQRG